MVTPPLLLSIYLTMELGESFLGRIVIGNEYMHRYATAGYYVEGFLPKNRGWSINKDASFYAFYTIMKLARL